MLRSVPCAKRVAPRSKHLGVLCLRQEEGPVMHPTIRTASMSPSSLPFRRRANKAAALHRAIDHTLEPLEGRRLYAVTATSAGGVLTVTGDNNANVITVSRDVAGKLLVNNGAVTINGSA